MSYEIDSWPPVKNMHFQNRCLDRVSARTVNEIQAGAFWDAVGDGLIENHQTDTTTLSNRPSQDQIDFVLFGVISSSVTLPIAATVDTWAYLSGNEIVTALAVSATALATITTAISAKGGWRLWRRATNDSDQLMLPLALIKEGQDLAQRFESFNQKVKGVDIDTAHPLRGSLVKVQGTVNRLLARAQGTVRPNFRHRNPSNGPTKDNLS